MANSTLAGKVQTVLGPVDPQSLGPTITHEHLLIDFTVVFQPPTNPADAILSEEKLSLGNLGWIRHNWNSSLDNLRLLDERVACSEATKYYEAGGRTIVDVTSNGLGRDPEALARISDTTGLNVVMGGGHYIGSTHPPEFDKYTAEDIAETIMIISFPWECRFLTIPATFLIFSILPTEVPPNLSTNLFMIK